MRYVIVCILIVLCASPCYGEERQKILSQDKIIQLDEIIVTGTVLKDTVEKPNTTEIIPSALLQGPSSTLDAALKRQPGIDVQRPQEVGGSLDDDSIKIRGFGSRRILVTIDGRLMNTPGTAGGYFVDWTTIPLSNIGVIEITKGVSDPRYGNALGGVINLVTKKPQKSPEIEAQASTGSFNKKSFDFYHAWKPGKFEYGISAGYSESNGYLYNGDFWIKNMSIYLGYELPWDGKITGNLQYTETKKGFIVPNRVSNNPDSPLYDVAKNTRYPASDGEIMYGGMGRRGQPEPGSWWNRERVTYSVGYEQSFTQSALKARYWENYGNREAYNTAVALNRVFHKKFYDDRSYGFDGTYRYAWNNHTITAGIDYSKLKDDGDKTCSGDWRGYVRNYNYVNADILGIFLMDDIYTYDKKILITPGIRFTSYHGKAGPAGRAEGIKNISMNGYSPSLKVTYNYTNNALAYISIARALRMPTPPEHYWHYSPDAGVITSNLPFKKEDGLMLQGGWKAILPTGTKIEFSPYYYFIKNYIQFDLINFVSYNIDTARLYGCEFGITQQINQFFSFFINYTYQRSKTNGDPFVANFVDPSDRNFDAIPGLPEHKINAGIYYKGLRKEKFGLFATYIPDQKIIYNNNMLSPPSLKVRTQGSYVTLDFEGSYPLTKHFELTGYIRNILDENYQERFGFPGAERNFGVGLRMAF